VTLFHTSYPAIIIDQNQVAATPSEHGHFGGLRLGLRLFPDDPVPYLRFRLERSLNPRFNAT